MGGIPPEGMEEFYIPTSSSSGSSYPSSRSFAPDFPSSRDDRRRDVSLPSLLSLSPSLPSLILFPLYIYIYSFYIIKYIYIYSLILFPYIGRPGKASGPSGPSPVISVKIKVERETKREEERSGEGKREGEEEER